MHELPPDDLLKHIHRQTTLLYSREHSDGFGRRLLDEEAWRASTPSRRKRKSGNQRPEDLSDVDSRSGTDDDNEGEDELHSSDDGNGSDRTMGSQRSSRSGKSLRRQTSRGSVISSTEQEDGAIPRSKRRGSWKDRGKNMYKALTGDTLIALGMCCKATD